MRDTTTCGLEDKLPKHRLIVEGQPTCYDSRKCQYKVAANDQHTGKCLYEQKRDEG